MARLIQYCTKASLYDGAFGGAVGWPAAGMGYVMRSESGSFIVVDGGFAEDAEGLVALMEGYSDGKPHIAKWIITHPHGDHYFALREISDDPALRERVSVDELIYDFPSEFINAKGEPLCVKATEDMKRIADALGAIERQPLYDERMSVDELEIRFLYVPDDCSIFNGQQNPNVCSLIFTVAGKGKKVTFTGDAFRRSLQVTVWRFGKALKCDILQMPHHALCDTGLMDFYKAADAKTLLSPISVAGHRSMHSGEHAEKDTAANLWAEENAEVVHNAFEGTIEIEI